MVTGVLAVGGAVWVGLRQLAITARQTRIAEQQGQLAELSFRHQLFDKRMRVYEGVANFLGAIVREAAYPSREFEVDFLSALGSARFLFPVPTYDGLQTIWDRAIAFRLLKIRMQASFDQEGHYGDGNPEQEEEALLWFFSRLQSLPDLFGAELRLT